MYHSDHCHCNPAWCHILSFFSQKAGPLFLCMCMCECVKVQLFLGFVTEHMRLGVCVWHLHNGENKSQINWLIFLLVRNSLADSKGTRQEIGPVPLISPMTDLWSLPEMEGKGTFPAPLTAQHLWQKRVCVRARARERLKGRVNERSQVSNPPSLVTTQPCMRGLGRWYPMTPLRCCRKGSSRGTFALFFSTCYWHLQV